MTPEKIVEILNNKFREIGYVFEKTDDEKNIVGFVDNGLFDNIIAVIDPTEEEMYKVIQHIEDHYEEK
jgi:hypothetical protein